MENTKDVKRYVVDAERDSTCPWCGLPFNRLEHNFFCQARLKADIDARTAVAIEPVSTAGLTPLQRSDRAEGARP